MFVHLCVSAEVLSHLSEVDYSPTAWRHCQRQLVSFGVGEENAEGERSNEEEKKRNRWKDEQGE